MKPKLKSNYIGIEVECLTTISTMKMKDLFNKCKMSDILTIGEDSSIAPDSEYYIFERDDDLDYYGSKKIQYAWEFKFLSTEKDLKWNLGRLNTFLKKINATVNNSCGLHVHIDCRERSFLKTFDNLVDYQETLFKIIPKGRRNNDYCKKVTKASIFEGQRHLAINPQSYRKHKTIEVRVHEGTVDTEEMYNWSSLLCSIADQKSLTMEQKSYVKSRARKFA